MNSARVSALIAVRSRLDKGRPSNQQLHELVDLVDWLRGVDEEIGLQRPLGGDTDALKTQDRDIKVRRDQPVWAHLSIVVVLQFYYLISFIVLFKINY